eukprot:CAMPEP_0115880602 /NCGR_PEP_ID=MMETSP0287-20121206/27967_1 /TAXON_ID=412157 /ORGANISM="Chrysochromulina rotalis, Strain UIO044" /LENGTH=213 /DNA_ID=CAMNT_0003336441 /DNA_START=73 /DNA_END=714 /DNA_ORIENTATION=+
MSPSHASPAADTAARLLRSFRLGVAFLQVYPGKKDAHLRAIASHLKRPLDRAIFFDDLPHNIKTAQTLGVGGCVRVQDGLTTSDVAQGLDMLRQRHRGSLLMRSWLGGGKRIVEEINVEDSTDGVVTTNGGNGMGIAPASEDAARHCGSSGRVGISGVDSIDSSNTGGEGGSSGCVGAGDSNHRHPGYTAGHSDVPSSSPNQAVLPASPPALE